MWDFLFPPHIRRCSSKITASAHSPANIPLETAEQEAEPGRSIQNAPKSYSIRFLAGMEKQTMEYVQVNTEFAEFHMSGTVCCLLELAWERFFRMVTRQPQFLCLEMLELDFGP